MVQPWAVEQMTDDHVRQLQSLRRRPTEYRSERPNPIPVSSMPSASGGPSVRIHRRPMGSHVGSWLIRAGTRLGGASVRTS